MRSYKYIINDYLEYRSHENISTHRHQSNFGSVCVLHFGNVTVVKIFLREQQVINISIDFPSRRRKSGRRLTRYVVYSAITIKFFFIFTFLRFRVQYNFLPFSWEFTSTLTPRLGCELEKMTSKILKNVSLMENIIITVSVENYKNKTCRVFDLLFVLAVTVTVNNLIVVAL